jgi:hypothetical protein
MITLYCFEKGFISGHEFEDVVLAIDKLTVHSMQYW